jgi:hypothetical protein
VHSFENRQAQQELPLSDPRAAADVVDAVSQEATAHGIGGAAADPSPPAIMPPDPPALHQSDILGLGVDEEARQISGIVLPIAVQGADPYATGVNHTGGEGGRLAVMTVEGEEAMGWRQGGEQCPRGIAGTVIHPDGFPAQAGAGEGGVQFGGEGKRSVGCNPFKIASAIVS